jgi:hypothetical protein
MWFTVAAALAATLLAAAQQQLPNSRAGWPCGARLDLSYFRVAEGSGGHLLLLAPEEISDSATLLTAFGTHPQTVFRTAGTMQPGLHEFPVSIESSVDSILFAIGVQCLQTAEVVRPSGALASGDDVIDYANFRAERMVIVRRPEPGVWTLRVAGRGISGIVVQAQGALAIEQLDFGPAPGAIFTAIPQAGVENVVRIRMGGNPSDVRASIVNGTFQHLSDLRLVADGMEGTFVSRFRPTTAAFRVFVTGKDADGHAFQRMSAPLLAPTR